MVICLLYGGANSEHDVSLASAREVYPALCELGHTVYPIFITKTDDWVFENAITDAGTLLSRLNPDFVFLALHGKLYEDGTLQSFLEQQGLRFNGPDSKASALCFDKWRASEEMKTLGYNVPPTIIVRKNAYSLTSLHAQLSLPCIVKPNAAGSSMGTTKVEREEDLVPAIDTAAQEDEKVLVQRYIPGKEFTCAVLGNGSLGITPLPVVEIVVPEGKLFDYQFKYHSLETQEICPANIDAMLGKRIQKLAMDAHIRLGCKGITRADVRYDPQSDELYFLELNTLPGLTANSLCPKEARALGWDMKGLLKMIIETS